MIARSSTLRRLAAFAALAAAAAAQAPIVTTVLANGSTATHYDMVILGDGYQAQEQAHFDQDVQAFLTGLFQKAPFALLGGYFNVHTVFRASQDSGATHPDVTPPILRNTAYGASYNTGGTARCLYISNTSQALADAALAPANESRVLVMVNDTRYGGCASTFAVSYNGASMIEVQSHELGHSIATLADEYDYPNGQYTGSEPNRVNITADSVGQKWSHWWGTEGVGAFEGAGYYLNGLWRPKANCLMRNLGVGLCPVCREQIVRTVNARASSIQSPQPASTTVALLQPALQTFSFTNIAPAVNNPTITWAVDGVTVPGQTGTSFVFDSRTASGGPHTVSVSVQDHTTEVRVDPAQTLVHSHAWSVTVTVNNIANLRLASAGVFPAFPAAGTDISFAVNVVNDGTATAANFVVEHWLSTNTVLDAGDLYLGATTVASLAAGQQVPVTTTHHLPAFLAAGAHIVLVGVDIPDVVPEASATDNITYAAIIAGLPSCTPTIEFRDTALYPRDHAAISLATGGTVEPTVTARCAPAGTIYAVALGCSGTQPGTPLATGVVLPINVDACTFEVIGGFNGPIFQSFFGFLDAQGIGRATLVLPPGLPVAPSPANVAAGLLHPDGTFFAATNAIALDLQ